MLVSIHHSHSDPMSTVTIEPLLHSYRNDNLNIHHRTKVLLKPNYVNYPLKSASSARKSFSFKQQLHQITANSSASAPASNATTFESGDVLFKETFPLKRIHTVEGKIFVRLEKKGEDEKNWQLSVGCDITGKWILHWGVSYIADTGSEWDQPPKKMRPPGSVSIKDYAIETPLKKLVEGDVFDQVKIDFDTKSDIAAINFVLKDEETGAWYQHMGRDFKVPLVDCLQHDGNVIGTKIAIGLWPGWRNH